MHVRVGGCAVMFMGGCWCWGMCMCVCACPQTQTHVLVAVAREDSVNTARLISPAMAVLCCVSLTMT
jgi:hypothetical protein